MSGIAAAPNHTIIYYPEIKTDNESNCYIAGRFKDSIDFDFDTTSTHYVYDSTWQFFLLKIDSNGTFKWVKHCEASMESGMISLLTRTTIVILLVLLLAPWM